MGTVGRRRPREVDEDRRLQSLVAEDGVGQTLLRYAVRGVRTQLVLRAALVVFVLGCVLFVPPARFAPACVLMAAGYAVWAGMVSGRVIRSRSVVVLRRAWLALFGDVVVLALLTVVASASDEQSWTADTLLAGFVLPPLLAATQLRPRIGVWVATATAVVYLGASVVARPSNGEPVASVLLGALVVGVLGMGCVLLSRVQRSRVIAIGELARERRQLLVEMSRVEERERQQLAETLHDSALQYLLAARQDVEELQERSEEAGLARVEHALRSATGLLRATVAELHPAVLEQLGLEGALRTLGLATQERSAVTVDVEVVGWPLQLRTVVDQQLFNAVRELLTNVVKHAHAKHTSIQLSQQDGVAVVTVTDDGLGFDETILARRLAEGHIGVAASRARLRALGGDLVYTRTKTGGTCAIASAPIQQQ